MLYFFCCCFVVYGAKMHRKKVKKILFAIVFVISFAIRVRWVRAGALALVLVFRGGACVPPAAPASSGASGALRHPVRPALGASCAILLMLARWEYNAHTHTHTYTHIHAQ